MPTPLNENVFLSLGQPSIPACRGSQRVPAAGPVEHPGRVPDGRWALLERPRAEVLRARLRACLGIN